MTTTMYRGLAGPDVDASWLASIVAARQDHTGPDGQAFDPSELAPIFAPYLGTDVRLRVTTFHPHGGRHTRTGRVGITTGWRPAFLLMHRSNDHGSWDVLAHGDQIVAYWDGRRYVDVPR